MNTDLILTRGYRANVWKKAGKCYVHIPQLSLLVSGPDVQTAWRKAEDIVAALYQEYTDAGMADSFPEGKPASNRWRAPFLSSGAAIFLGKTLVLGIVVILALDIAATAAIRNFNRNFGEVRTGKISASIHSLADGIRNAPPETRNTIRDDLRLIIGEARLILEEASGGKQQ